MLRVLFYCNTFYPKNNGFSNAFVNLVKAISRHRPDIYVDVVTPEELGTHNELQLQNVEVIRIQCSTKVECLRFFVKRALIALELRRRFLEYEYSMLFVETLCDPLLISLLSKPLLRKMVVRLHSTDDTEGTVFHPGLLHRLKRHIFSKIAVHKMRYVASTNNYHLEFFKKYFLKNNVYEIAKRTFFTIPNTVDCEELCHGRAVCRHNTRLRFLMIGKLYKWGCLQKGHQDLISALSLLDVQRLREEIQVTVIGQGAWRTRLIEIARIHKLDCIEFVESMGHAQALNLLYENDIAVLPSRFEGASMFALEALATGNVVLFSRVGGLVDLVDGNGYSFEAQNIEDLAQAVQKLMDLDRKEIERMKQKSIELFHARFDEKALAERFSKVLSIVKTESVLLDDVLSRRS